MTLNEFFANLEREVRNHSIYVWGRSGEKAPTITEAWIKKKENSTANANRAIKFWKKQVAAGYGDVLRAFDCSGLGTYCLGKSKAKANTMMGCCKKIDRKDLKPGDWVFRTDSGGKATHIGYVVDSALNVIESKGRDDGVVKRALNASGTTYWNRCGRPDMFKTEIESGTPAITPTKPVSPTPSAPRLLKLTSKPYMSGDDVKLLQAKLAAKGFSPGKVDGYFGPNTDAAVRACQKVNNLTIDGICGPKTRKVLGL